MYLTPVSSNSNLLDMPDQRHAKELDRIYRKLDLRIIPALWCMYFITSFGSGCYGLTLTMNREEGHSLIQQLNLTSRDISLANAMSFIGFIIFDLPMNLIMTKVRPQTWLARIAITVGIVYSCYFFLKNALGLIAINFVSGVVGAGTWPGMSYYISLWYPNERSTRRIGYYFTAAQLSAALAGLVSAGVQKMDGLHGYSGWQWMYLISGVICAFVGIVLLWWLPGRPNLVEAISDSSSFERSDESLQPLLRPKFWNRLDFVPYPLNEEEQKLHRIDMSRRHPTLSWGWNEIVEIITDARIWPLIMMYFGCVGTGFGISVFGSTIIAVNNPNLTSIEVSLLFAPIWLFYMAGTLSITPFADKHKAQRAAIFSLACCITITGLFVTTFAPQSWGRYTGLLISGYGLGPAIPICMTWSADIFHDRYGDVGTAVSAALVSGLGNLGSVTSTYALYTGWPSDKARLYKYSNMMLVVMLLGSIIASGVCHYLKDKVRQKRII